MFQDPKLQHLVASRLDWLRHLRKAFDQAMSDSSAPAQIAIPIQLLLTNLVKSANSLGLQHPGEYYSNHSSLALSLSDVLSACSSLYSTRASWDQIMESILRTKPGSAQYPGRIDLSYPTQKLVWVSPELLYSGLEQLSLAGNSLTHTNWGFPSSLIVLNLAGNELKQVILPPDLKSLQLLNVTNNRIQKIQGLPVSLKELLLGYNSIEELNSLEAAKELSLVDLSYNLISNVKQLQPLTQLKHLQTLKLKGNSVTHSKNSTESVKALLPELDTLDPANITEFSQFRYELLPLVPLKKPKTKTFNLHLIPAEPDTRLKRLSSLSSPVSPRFVFKRNPSTGLGKIEKEESSNTYCFTSPSEVLKPILKKSTTQLLKQPRKVVITKEYIDEHSKVSYGNPAKALMIGPASQPYLRLKKSTVAKKKARRS